MTRSAEDVALYWFPYVFDIPDPRRGGVEIRDFEFRHCAPEDERARFVSVNGIGFPCVPEFRVRLRSAILS